MILKKNLAGKSSSLSPGLDHPAQFISTTRSSVFIASANWNSYGFTRKRLAAYLLLVAGVTASLPRWSVWAGVETILNAVHSILIHWRRTKNITLAPSQHEMSCTKRKWIDASVVPCEIGCEMLFAQPLQTLSSLTAVLWGSHLKK
jgi:hypothetical protein